MFEYKVTVDGKTYDISIGNLEDDRVDVTLDGRSFSVEVELQSKDPVRTKVPERPRDGKTSGPASVRKSPSGRTGASGDVLAPLPGAILKILVKEGDVVSEGQPVATMEAMKMENEVEAPIAGRVSSILVKQGETILENALLMKIEV
jgi:glutaconyl-CoA/methylmalonyl-CoA decarboxylase subunit gamma